MNFLQKAKKFIDEELLVLIVTTGYDKQNLKYLPDNIYNQSKNNTNDNHRNYREIESCIFRFKFNISR